jgi:hypothetical protein
VYLGEYSAEEMVRRTGAMEFAVNVLNFFRLSPYLGPQGMRQVLSSILIKSTD